MSLAFLLVSLGCCIIWAYLSLMKKVKYWEVRGVPYVGIKNFFKKPATYLTDAHVEFKAQQTKFGGIHVFLTPVLLIVDLDLATNILVKDFHYFEDRFVDSNLETDPMSGGLFFSLGHDWKTKRRNTASVFTQKNLKMLQCKLVEDTLNIHKHMDTAEQMDGEINFADVAYNYTVETTRSLFFGTIFNVIKDQVEYKEVLVEFRTMFYNAVKFIFLRGFFPYFNKIFRLKLVNAKHTELMTQHIGKSLQERMKNDTEEVDLAGLFLQLRNVGKINLTGTAAQFATFYGSQLHLMSETLEYVICELALNQEIQERAREEMRKCLEKYDGKCSYDACMEMKYVDQIVHETFRKYPIAYLIFRRCTKDYKVPETGFVIKKGTRLMISVYNIHYDPAIYPDPETFDPERFTEEAIATRHPNAWLPFGAGPRFCIAKRFSMMQLRVGLVNFLMNYRIRVTPRTATPFKFDLMKGLLNKKEMSWLKFEKI